CQTLSHERREVDMLPVAETAETTGQSITRSAASQRRRTSGDWTDGVYQYACTLYRLRGFRSRRDIAIMRRLVSNMCKLIPHFLSRDGQIATSAESEIVIKKAIQPSGVAYYLVYILGSSVPLKQASHQCLPQRYFCRCARVDYSQAVF